MIHPNKWEQLRQDMRRLEIDEKDLEERFILGSGSGGQKVNKSHTCVTLQHASLGINIKCQQTRSREDNRFYARRRLCDKVKEQREGELSAKQQADAKLARQKRRRSRRAKQKMLENKRHTSKIKQSRSKPTDDSSS